MALSAASSGAKVLTCWTALKLKRNGSISALVKELWQAAVNLRGSIEAPDYKRYVLPIIFCKRSAKDICKTF